MEFPQKGAWIDRHEYCIKINPKDKAVVVSGKNYLLELVKKQNLK